MLMPLRRPTQPMPPVSIVTAEHASPEAAAAFRALDGSLVRGLAWTGAVKWTSQVLSWLSTIVVARLLLPRDYGLVAMATVVLGLIALLNEFGLGAAVVALRHLTRDQIAQIHSVASLLGMAGFLLVGALAVPVGRFFGAPELPPVMVTMGASFLLVATRSVPSAILQKELRFKFLAFLEGGQSVLTTLVTIVMAWSGAGYWALVVGGLIGNAGTNIVIWVSRPLRYAWPSSDSLRETIRFSSHVLVSRVSWYLAGNADVFIAGRVLGQAVLGAYSFAATLATVPLDKVTALISRVMPAFYSSVQDDASAMRRYLLILTEGLALITFPLAAGLVLVAHDSVLVVLGDKWRGVIAPLQVLAGWAALRSVVGLVSPLLYVTEGSRVAMFNGLLCAATYPPAFWLGTRWGAVGVAAAWVLVQPPSWIAPYRHVLRATHLSSWRYLQAFWPALSGVLVMGACVYGVGRSLPEGWSAAWRLVCEVTVGAAAYAAAVLWLHGDRVKSAVRIIKTSRAM